MRRLGWGVLAGLVVLAAAAWPAYAAEPAVVFLSDEPLELTASQSAVEVQILNLTAAPTATRVLIEPPDVADATWGCADTPLESFASPTPTTPGDEEVAGSVLQDLQAGALGCLTLKVAEAPDSDQTAAVTLVTVGGTQQRKLTVAAEAADAVTPKKASDNGALVWDPEGGVTGPWALYQPTDVSLGLADLTVPDGETIGFVDGPDGLHPVENSNGKATIAGLSEAGTYTGSLDLTPGDEGGDVEISVDVGLQGGPGVAIALIVLGIGVTTGLYYLATNRLPALAAGEKIHWSTLAVRRTQERLRAAFDTAVPGLDVGRWNRWRLLPHPNEDTADPATKLAAAWTAVTQDDWTEDTVTRVTEAAGSYQTTANAGVRLLRLRYQYRAFPAAVLEREIDAALFDPLPGSDPIGGLGARCTALDTGAVRQIAALAEEYPILASQVPAGENPLRTKLNALGDALRTATGADLDNVTAKRADFEAARPVIPAAPGIAGYEIEDAVGLTSGGDDALSTDETGIQAEIARIRKLRQRLGIALVIAALAITGVVAFKENYLDNASTWGSLNDVMTALTWTVAASGAINIARIALPTNKLTELLLK